MAVKLSKLPKWLTAFHLWMVYHMVPWKKSPPFKKIVSGCCSRIFRAWWTRRAYPPKQLPSSESRCLHAPPSLLASSKRQWISLVCRIVKLNEADACLTTKDTQNRPNSLNHMSTVLRVDQSCIFCSTVDKILSVQRYIAHQTGNRRRHKLSTSFRREETKSEGRNQQESSPIQSEWTSFAIW